MLRSPLSGSAFGFASKLPSRSPGFPDPFAAKLRGVGEVRASHSEENRTTPCSSTSVQGAPLPPRADFATATARPVEQCTASAMSAGLTLPGQGVYLGVVRRMLPP